MGQGGHKAVVAGALGNGAIAACKLGVGALAGSASLLAEGLHSAVDTGNSLLMLLGQRRAARPPDALHPFGHGKELYFWTTTVALVMFATSGLVAVAEGGYRLVRPGELEDPKWVYVVVAVAAVLAGLSLGAAYRELRKEDPGRPLRELVTASKDPGKFNVVLEDGAELVGLAVVAAATWLSHRLDMPRLDAAGSLLIGLLMCGVALFLANENRKLLVGERVERELMDELLALAERSGAFEEVRGVRSMQLGPDRLLAVIEGRLEVGPGLTDALDALAAEAKRRHPELGHLALELREADRPWDGEGLWRRGGRGVDQGAKPEGH